MPKSMPGGIKFAAFVINSNSNKQIHQIRVCNIYFFSNNIHVMVIQMIRQPKRIFQLFCKKIIQLYSKTCLKRSLKNSQNEYHNDKW